MGNSDSEREQSVEQDGPKVSQNPSKESRYGTARPITASQHHSTCIKGGPEESLGQMSLSPQNGLTVTVWASSVGRLSLKPPSA